MPLVKRGGERPDPAVAAPLAGLDPREALRSADPALRRAAARALGEGGDPAPLAEALASEPDLRVREALLTALIGLGAAPELVPFLRSEEAGLRALAVEAMQAMPEQAAPLLPALLQDPDPDVRILAAEALRAQPRDLASGLLSRALGQESHPNVCAAVVEVLAELGTPDAVPALQSAALRFRDDPFLPFAIPVALARIGGGRS